MHVGPLCRYWEKYSLVINQLGLGSIWPYPWVVYSSPNCQTCYMSGFIAFQSLVLQDLRCLLSPLGLSQQINQLRDSLSVCLRRCQGFTLTRLQSLAYWGSLTVRILLKTGGLSAKIQATLVQLKFDLAGTGQSTGSSIHNTCSYDD